MPLGSRYAGDFGSAAPRSPTASGPPASHRHISSSRLTIALSAGEEKEGRRASSGADQNCSHSKLFSHKKRERLRDDSGTVSNSKSRMPRLDARNVGFSRPGNISFAIAVFTNSSLQAGNIIWSSLA